MAKLSKIGAIEEARRIAIRAAEKLALSVEQIQAMDYAAMRDAATALMQQTPEIANLDVPDKFMGDVVNAFTSQVSDVWRSKVKQLDNARKSFARACTGLTQEFADKAIQDLLTSMHIRGARISSGSCEVLRGDRDGATLNYRFNREDGETVNPDDARHRAYSYALHVSISTTGTSYSPARMALVCKIQHELLDAAAEIQALFERERVVYVYGAPVVETPVETAAV